MATKKTSTTAAATPAPSTAPLLTANVPQQISYSGQNYIELRLPAGAFLASALGGVS
jgi:hypothetical protein